MIFYVSIHPHKDGVEATLTVEATQVCIIANAYWGDKHGIEEVRGWGLKMSLLMHYTDQTTIVHEHEALDLLIHKYEQNPWNTSKEYTRALLDSLYELEDLEREALRKKTEAMEGDAPWI